MFAQTEAQQARAERPNDETPKPAERLIDVYFMVPVRFTIPVKGGTLETAAEFAKTYAESGKAVATIEWDARSPAGVSYVKLTGRQPVAETVPQSVSMRSAFAKWDFLKRCVSQF